MLLEGEEEDEEEEEEEDEIPYVPPNLDSFSVGYLVSNASQQPDDCIICLESFRQGDHARTLECMHTYHHACIKQWLDLRSFCPVCKRVCN